MLTVASHTNEQRMRLHILSDLHNEFHPYVPAANDADLVILAGDIDVRARGVAWAAGAFDCPVLYVPGNHEYYKGHLTGTLEKMREAQTDRVRVLDRDEFRFGDVRFLGATMWTDYSSMGDVTLATLSAQMTLNDFRRIRVGSYRRLRPTDVIEEALKTRQWLLDKLAEPWKGKTVVITHHAPSLRSMKGHPYSGDRLDAAYANAWDDLMGERIDLWVHGHVHTRQDYELSGTRVLSNPRGYPEQQTGFDPDLIIEI